MLYFLTTHRNQHTIRSYLEAHGAPLAHVLVPITYERLLQQSESPLGTYFFADVELLSDRQRVQATQVWQQLSERGCQLFNHPSLSCRRYDLLRTLYEHGNNRFNVFRLSDNPPPQRFPIFLRGENDHEGSRSPLLTSRAELDGALKRARRPWSRLKEPLVTEFCDTADSAGIYRKYSAFVVGDRVVPRHLFFSARWMVKKWEVLNDALAREERHYVETNPHEQSLRRIFALARIDYGRIDYALLDGAIQVWEINTNPTIIHSNRGAPGPRAAIHETFARQLQEALEEIEATTLARSPAPRLDAPHAPGRHSSSLLGKLRTFCTGIRHRGGRP